MAPRLLLLALFVAVSAGRPDECLPDASKLKIMLLFNHQPSKMEQLEATFWEISDPASALSRQFISREQAAAFTAPDSRSLDAVGAWLATTGVSDVVSRPGGGSIYFNASVATARRLFDRECFNPGTGAPAGPQRFPELDL